MKPHTLAGAVLLLWAAPALAQPATDDGLPGGPVLPSNTTPASTNKKDETKQEEEKGRMARVAAAVADYLTRSFVKDAGITADGWLSWAKPSKDTMPANHSRRIRVRIKTKTLEAELDDTYNRTDGVESLSRKELIKFKDMIGKTIVEVGFDGQKDKKGDGTSVSKRDDAHALGWKFSDENILRFEMTLKKDTAASVHRQKYRAILKTAPFKGTDESRTFINIGLERVYNAPKHKIGETNGVIGLENRLERKWDKKYLRLRTTIEVTGGSKDKTMTGDSNPVTLGAAGKLALETGGKNWDATVTAYEKRNSSGLSLNGSGLHTDRDVVERGIKLTGEWRFNEGRHKLFTTLESSIMKTTVHSIDTERVWRNKGELGIEFNNRWRVGINGTYNDFGRGKNDWTVGFTVGFRFGR